MAAEALLSIAGDEVVPVRGSDDRRKGTTTPPPPPREEEEDSSSVLFFPRVKAVLAFDTPYLGISPGVLAHGAEEQIGHANKAYQAYDQAASFFGWGNNNKSAATPQPITNASSKGLPAPGNAGGGGFKWGKLAMYAGAAAGIAGVAGAAYMGWNHINQGVAWASSHLEFVSCLARGAELQKRVEKVVALTSTHDVGFANFYGALDPEKVMSKTKYAGQLLGEDRTFCVIPKQAKEKIAHAERGNRPTDAKRPSSPPSSDDNRGPKKDQKARQDSSSNAANEQHMSAENEQVRAFADDRSKSKGRWVKCVNSIAGDEITAHQSMFVPDKNPDYHAMLPRARDQVLEWIDWKWYEQSEKKGEGEEPDHDDMRNHDDNDDDDDNDGNNNDDDDDKKMEDRADGGDVTSSSSSTSHP